MPYNAKIHHRKSIRLKNFDYSSVGAYFITLAINHRMCLLGDIHDGKLAINSAGEMVADCYKELEIKFPHVKCDEFICMPNHLHFIIFIRNPVEQGQVSLVQGQTSLEQGQTHRSAPTNIGAIIQWFKTMTTNAYIRNVKQNDWQPFHQKLWQRNYWERIIRNETELQNMRNYIIQNPSQWQNGELFHP